MFAVGPAPRYLFLKRIGGSAESSSCSVQSPLAPCASKAGPDLCRLYVGIADGMCTRMGLADVSVVDESDPESSWYMLQNGSTATYVCKNADGVTRHNDLRLPAQPLPPSTTTLAPSHIEAVGPGVPRQHGIRPPLVR